MPGKQPAVITISRQMASGGGYLGHLLARKLGYRYLERQVLYEAARELGAAIADLSSQDERKSGFLENVLKSFVFGAPETGYTPPAGMPVYDRDLFKKESEIIRSVAARYDAVIVGRGGYSALRNHSNALHVFLYAPLNFRIRRYQTFHPGTDRQIREILEHSDRERERFLKSMTGTDWYDTRNYHLSIDVSRSGFPGAERMVMEMVNNMPAAPVH